ncbi:MAG: hypothetical protein R3C03_23950 [Pirellulaceae bacterium]
MSLKIELTEKGLTVSQLKKELPEIKRPAYDKLGVHFHQVNLPRRFTVAGGRMLGFKRRSPKYEKRKRKLKGHTDPLRFSDDSKRLATTIQDIRVKTTEKKSEVKVVIHARGLNRRNPRSNIRMQDEVRRVANREFGPLTRVLQRGIDEQMKQRDYR